MKIFKPIGKYIIKNLPSILSVAGSVGLVATAVLSAKATPKAVEIFEKAHKEDEPGKTSVMTIVLAAKPYIPAMIVGGASIACIMSANGIHVRRYLNVCHMYNHLADEYSMFKIGGMDNILSAAGGGAFVAEKEQEKRYELMQSMPDLDKEGEVIHWFYDVHSMTWYQSTWNKVKDAASHLNDTYAYNGFAPLFDYYMELGIYDRYLDPSLGWDCDRLMSEYGCPFIPFEYAEKTYLDGSRAYSVWFPIEPVIEGDGY